MKKYFAELVGTFILVLFGCGTAVVAGDKVCILGIAIAFGLALIGEAAYGIGPISGCHINPAVSLGVWAARPHETRRDDRLLDRPVCGCDPRCGSTFPHRARVGYLRHRPSWPERLGTGLHGRLQHYLGHRL